MKYNTKQKEIILNYLKNNNKECITINEIYQKLNKEVGKVTIYRYLEQLEKENIVNKYSLSNKESATYKFNGCLYNNHIHLMCFKCEKIIHIDCKELEEHIKKDHNFTPDMCKTTIYGICKECENKGENNEKSN
ncbi:MAG: transcriptional repressor [Bacilli bacterium]|nr:transcriptional repressor [Bacilli bacterium]